MREGSPGQQLFLRSPSRNIPREQPQAGADELADQILAGLGDVQHERLDLGAQGVGEALVRQDPAETLVLVRKEGILGHFSALEAVHLQASSYWLA